MDIVSELKQTLMVALNEYMAFKFGTTPDSGYIINGSEAEAIMDGILNFAGQALALTYIQTALQYMKEYPDCQEEFAQDKKILFYVSDGIREVFQGSLNQIRSKSEQAH